MSLIETILVCLDPPEAPEMVEADCNHDPGPVYIRFDETYDQRCKTEGCQANPCDECLDWYDGYCQKCYEKEVVTI